MSNFYNPPPGDAPNLNGQNPLRPFYGSPLDSPLQSFYQQNPALDYGADAPENTSALEATMDSFKFGLIKYLKLAVDAPFDSALTLLQVQYMPNQESVKANGDDDDNDSPAEQERRDEEFRREQEAAEEEEFFTNECGSGGYYSSNTYNTNHFPTPRSGANKLDPNSAVFKERKEFDQSGYLIRTDVYDDDSRPSFQLAPIEGGVWQVNKALFYHPTEGWTSPFKGHNASWFYEMLHLFAQPSLEASLNDAFGLYDDTVPLVQMDSPGPNLATLVTSHLVTGFILSPLELVRTRLVVQSSDPKQRKYSSIFNCISTIIYEEGFTALWGGVNVVPTILYHTISPLLTNSVPLIIERILGISPEDSPFSYEVAELCLEILDLLIRLPIETVRKRLQIQIQAKIPGKRYETVVETRKRPYAGFVDCVYRIIREEGGPRRKRRSKKHGEDEDNVEPTIPWYGAWGVRGLYTGLGLHLSGSLVTFAIASIAGLDVDTDDW
ncbi:hypothetical protein BGZ79_010245 [Entomortierella chlamydospora]|nr:hypothetical protein BGZ79_010245 [Entomortierella chlamydospora]